MATDAELMGLAALVHIEAVWAAWAHKDLVHMGGVVPDVTGDEQPSDAANALREGLRKRGVLTGPKCGAFRDVPEEPGKSGSKMIQLVCALPKDHDEDMHTTCADCRGDWF